MGRPTDYTEEIADKIVLEFSTTNKSIRTVCKEIGISPVTLYNWMDDNEEFMKRYVRAREAQADLLAEEILEIADASNNDTMTVNKNGKEVEVENTEWVNRSKLKIDARKWIASKLKPKTYGEKSTVDTNVKFETPIFTGIDLNVPENNSPIEDSTTP